MARIGVLLSGCGVFDGAEIHESVLTMLALDRAGAEIICMAPNVEQHHVINHLTQEEMAEKRNVLVESARIARGEIKDIKEVKGVDLWPDITRGVRSCQKPERLCLQRCRFYSSAGG